MRFKIGWIIWVCVFGLVSCKQNVDNTDKNTESVTYTSIGKNITNQDVLEPIDVIMQYEVMRVVDTIESKIMAKVSEVCQSNGCWMILDLGDETEIMVKFKNYDFFVPKDIVGKDVIVNGVAYIDDISVEKQQHYAKDAGKTSTEIASIVQPKRTLSLKADGVLIKN